MNRILFITALQAEAKPLIEFYQLGKKQLNERLFYFQNDDIICLTTGVGENNVHTRLSVFLEKIDCKNLFLVNVGIAGGKSEKTEIGEMYTAKKITHEKNNRISLPENLIKYGFKTLPLVTVSEGITDGGMKYSGLVDMESAVIIKVASKRIPAKRMIFLKIVSDHMDKVLFKSEQVILLVEKQFSKIHRVTTLIRENKILQ